MKQSKAPERQLPYTQVDTKAFVDQMRRLDDTLAQMATEMAIVLGDVCGHQAVATALNARIAEYDRVRTDLTSRMLDAAWQAADGRASRHRA